MAFAKLRQETGEGDLIGLFGATATELFHVQVDFVNSDPIAVVNSQLINDPYNRTGIVIGSTHPDAQFNLAKASEFIKLEKTTPISWDVLVVYRTADQVGLSGSFHGWKVQTTFTSSTEKMARSLPDLDARGKAINDGRLIGPALYRIAADGETHTHIVPSPLKTGDIKLVIAGRVTSGEDEGRPYKKVVGFDRFRIDMSITMSAVASTMSFSILRQLRDMAGKVNVEKWNTFPPRTLLWPGFTQAEEVIDTPRGLDFQYPVSITFLQRPERWTPVAFIDTYKDSDSGNDVEVEAVTAPGKVIKRSYRVYEEVPFADIFKKISILPPNATREGRRASAPFVPII